MLNYIPKENIKSSGIYCIENLIDGKKYIGSTTNFQKRFSKHLYELGHGYHPSLHLQNAYKKYGSENFKFSIVKILKRE